MQTTIFKSGDKVKRLNYDCLDIKVGDILTVRAHDFGTGLLFFERVGGGYGDFNFELVERKGVLPKQLFLVYDDWGLSREVSHPVLYSSKENLLKDFLEVVQDAATSDKVYFEFLGAEFNTYNFIDTDSNGTLVIKAPKILTVDDVFKQALTVVPTKKGITVE